MLKPLGDLSKDESILLVQIKKKKNHIIFEHNADNLMEAASLIKVFYALEVFRRIEQGLIKNQVIKIKPEMVNKYGTNVLGDIVIGKNNVSLDIRTLVGLMIKYSCNSSTNIILKYFLPPRQQLEKIAYEVWGLENIQLVSDKLEEIKNISLDDLLKLYSSIYGPSPILKQENDLLKEKLRTSRNIYYLFDQLEVNVLGSKSGTLSKDGFYWVGDSGVIEINGHKYFIGSIVKRKHISDAVKRIRRLGQVVIEELRAYS